MFHQVDSPRRGGRLTQSKDGNQVVHETHARKPRCEHLNFDTSIWTSRCKHLNLDNLTLTSQPKHLHLKTLNEPPKFTHRNFHRVSTPTGAVSLHFFRSLMSHSSPTAISIVFLLRPVWFHSISFDSAPSTLTGSLTNGTSDLVNAI
jgi:hypothetical protein